MAVTADAADSVRVAVEPEHHSRADSQVAAWAERIRKAAARRLRDRRREPVTAIRESSGELLALADDSQVWFSPAIAALDSDHPRWRFAAMVSIVARLMQEGGDAQPYDHELAAYYARYILIPTGTFALYAGVESDARLAERFNVPLDEIAAKRRDLALARGR